MATITTGITSESYGGNSYSDSEAYQLPTAVEHRAPGSEVKIDKTPGRTAGASNPAHAPKATQRSK